LLASRKLFRISMKRGEREREEGEGWREWRQRREGDKGPES
jgi:hypothetical protein